ncbi:MAG: response regulator [Pirellulales bacterium]|nr:response regulator [Pirellulales bacterium]
MVADTPSILITDDDRHLRETLRDVLTPEGYRTLLASDGVEAYEIVQKDHVDLVLLDMHMPRMGGLQTLRLVKQYESRLPCILMSAEMDDAIQAEAEEADVYSILRKPVSRIDLTNSVKQALYRAYGWG